jgi:RNA polymerase sigma factor (sigma-70 family)
MIAVRTVLDHLRKKGVDAMVWQKKCVPLEDLPELKANGAEPVVEMEKAEKERLLRDGMQRLPPRQRLFMKLHFEQGLPVGKVAEAMTLSVGNAYTLKHRAIEKLKLHIASAAKNFNQSK